MTDADLIDQAASEETDNWLTTLLDETEYTARRVREGGYSLLSGPHILQANSSRLDSIAGEGWLAVGDAAAAFDPLSSYGITSAMGGGFYAASAILDSFAGDARAPLSYQKLVVEAYAHYLAMHYEHYSLERRWPNETFWRRRHEMYNRTP
jgi:flavin-dependent dehydrogenase